MNKTAPQLPRAIRMATLLVLAIGALAFMALLVASCGGDKTTTTVSGTETTAPATTISETTTVSDSTTDSTSTTVGGTTTTEALSSAESRQADGSIKAMGYITKVWVSGGVRYIRIDYADMLTGAAAQKAAEAAGVIGPGEDLPNDYYIQNTSKKTRDFKVASSVTLKTSTWNGVMDKPITWAQFISFWKTTPPSGADYLHQSPWWIIRVGDTVISIEEQYLP